ncbi:type I restriction endonuclease subunit R [Paenibacillus sp. FSL P4-0081]|uniref:type I restriction endonuclease subunit R n=1 Tax=Paenibacillus sp. FSL P4-0081 TaxID=1536769 RepID=UPI0009DD45A4|nr:DEAD/DEAH box helicase family protein [Paenibacillus sp. FSL P4-0081]
MQDNEKRFEQDIESFFLSPMGGYIKSDQKTYNRDKAIDMVKLVSFLSTSQPIEWDRQVKRDGEDAQVRIYRCLQTNIDSHGLIYVLRHGIIDRGIKFKLAFFRPETSLNADVVKLYNLNNLTCTRQFKYSTQNENSIDMVLSLNGIPVVALELKNQLKGQSVDNAKRQFMYDRNNKEFIFGFNNRLLVYFAVDLYEVAMTTQLNGKDTFFLPFNQGSKGAGEVGGAGNPAFDGEGYITSYLWEKVLQKDTLLDIIQRYIHLDISESTEKVNGKRKIKTSKKIIFPRYHQLDVVTKLLSDVKANGSGKNYLIQHSAGSGKSNSIAWLAYRLSTLHDKDNKSVFTSVIVVTDRRVLDHQLQNTISGFDHIEGLVETIDEKKTSKDLRDAVNDGKKIIITTLQKFPVIYDEIDDNKGRKFAIIVDEAHSSQTGNSAKKLKAALADVEEALKEYAEIENKAEIDVEDAEDNLIKELITHGRHKNLSFFAFTATPKEKTLEMFGEKQHDGTFRAFHIYSMQQAIEEEFILDVLKNYMTYKTCFKIAKNTPDNPEVPTTKAVKAVRRYQELHPHNLQQKTAVMIEQFREITKNKISGNAKAMVVTASRLHAVRYYHEFKRYIEKNKYNDIDILIAFSGVINDLDRYGETVAYTEEGMNKRIDKSTIKEKQLPEEFHHDYNCLIVAEKYQTGFDEPLLHTMFVDKKLDGVKAVQTLSRLNRTCRGKEDTFILDFVNSTEDMKKSFSRFYEATFLNEEININLIYQAQNVLRKFKLYNDVDIEKFIKIYYKNGQQTDKDLGKMTALLKPVVERYNDLDVEKRYEYRMTIRNFNKWYSYIAQIIRMFDKSLQREFAFTSYLAKILPKEDDKKVDLEDKLRLEFYKLEETFKGDISLNPTKDEQTLVNPNSFVPESIIITDDELLENIINRINERFNGMFTEGDKVIVETIYNRIVKDNKKLRTYAKNNDAEVFERSIFPEIFKKITQECYMESMSSFSKLFEDKKFYNSVMEEIARESYKDLRSQTVYSESKIDQNSKVAEDREKIY